MQNISKLIGKTIENIIMREIPENPGIKYIIILFTDHSWAVLTDTEENRKIFMQYIKNIEIELGKVN